MLKRELVTLEVRTRNTMIDCMKERTFVAIALPAEVYRGLAAVRCQERWILTAALVSRASTGGCG
jgi:hypothetical protein